MTGVLRLNLVVSIRMTQTGETLHFEVACGLWDRLIWVTVLPLVLLECAPEFLLVVRRFFFLARRLLRLHFWQISLRVVDVFSLIKIVFLAGRCSIQKLSIVALLGITSLIIRHVGDLLVVQLDVIDFRFCQRVVAFPSLQNAGEITLLLLDFFLKVLGFLKVFQIVLRVLDLYVVWVGRYNESLIPLS